MSLENESLRNIYELLSPQTSEKSPNKDKNSIDLSNSKGSATSTAGTTSTVSSTNINNLNSISNNNGSSSNEFIPHVFYSLYNITKDPNNSSNNLESATGFIRHRLRSSKQLIKDDTKLIELLSKSTEDWEKFLESRRVELNVKNDILQKLKLKIDEINKVD